MRHHALTTTITAATAAQEIAGNEVLVGQYESMKAFTMPGLYRVVEVWIVVLSMLALARQLGTGSDCARDR